jgi:hypothetical protein
MATYRNVREKIEAWRDDPVLFVEEEFGAVPDLWQRDMLWNYRNGSRSGAKACKGPGKTTCLAWIAWHFLICYVDAKVAATSISGENLRDGLWTEMAKWQNKGKVSKSQFTWHAERIVNNDHPETWFMSARRWPKSADPEAQANTLAGLHADSILFLLDEVGDIPDAVMAAAEAALANAGTEVNPNAIAKLVIAGNPTNLSGPLYRACTSEATLWKIIEISGDPDDPKRSPRISIQWAREQIQKYGRDNPWVLVNVFGKFPPSSINALLGPDEVHAAMTRVLRPEVWMNDVKILGVDVALQGGDRTVIAPRQGLVGFKPKVLRLSDPKDIASHVGLAIKKWEPDAVFIDNTGGWGSGVISWLRDWGHSVTPVQFSQKAMDNVYYNKRSEMHHEFAQWVKGGGCIPNMQELKEEITAQTYTHHKSQLLMTDKDQIKQALGRSPDLMDAYVLTFAFPVARRNAATDAMNHQDREYNPIETSQKISAVKDIDYNPLTH